LNEAASGGVGGAGEAVAVFHRSSDGGGGLFGKLGGVVGVLMVSPILLLK
jgi:hypothetical protein